MRDFPTALFTQDIKTPLFPVHRSKTDCIPEAINIACGQKVLTCSLDMTTLVSRTQKENENTIIQKSFDLGAPLLTIKPPLLWQQEN